MPALAYRASNFIWALYGFNSGHFPSTIVTRNLPFRIVLACDPWESNRALLHEFVCCPTILPSASALLDHIRASGDQGNIDGYLIHSHRYQNSEPGTAFWSIQASIVAQLRLIRRLNLFVAFVHPDHDGRSVSKFVITLTSSGWVISSTKSRSRIRATRSLGRQIFWSVFMIAHNRRWMHYRFESHRRHARYLWQRTFGSLSTPKSTACRLQRVMTCFLLTEIMAFKPPRYRAQWHRANRPE